MTNATQTTTKTREPQGPARYTVDGHQIGGALPPRCSVCNEYAPDAEVESKDGSSLVVVCTSCADDC